MNRTLEIRPGTPSVRVIDLGLQGLLNPNPLSREEEESLVDEYLSPARLKALTGVDDLQDVKTLQMCVDTREHTLGNFGEGCFLGTYIPNLRQLKLNNSVIMSVRDLGTSLSHLQVLWMARCGLTDLDGISSFFSLKELYVAYNDLRDLSQVSMLENLEILDLEGNNLDHISELQYLALCSNLTSLTVEGNPICARPSPEDTKSPDYNYRAVIRSMIPQLQYLDDVPADQINPTQPRTPTQDWLMVKDYIKENAGSQGDTHLDLGNALRKTTIRPSTAQPGLTRRPQSAPRPSSAGKAVAGLKSARGSPLSEPSEDSPVDDEASDLTHGVGKIICGNPIKALRARKEKFGSTPGTSLQSQVPKPEHTLDSVMTSHKDRDDVFAELKAWRETHHELLQRIQNERTPQVLTVTHSDEEEGDSLSSSEDEELEDTWDSGCIVRVSPETSSPSPQSLAADTLYLGEMTLQDAPRQPSPPITPCPPASISANSRPNKGANIRARRLLTGFNQSKTIVPRMVATNACLGDEAFLPTDIDDNMIRTTRIIQSNDTVSSEPNGRPVSGPAQLGHSNSRSTLDRNAPRLSPSHQPVIRSSTKTPERPSPPQLIRPITTKGILTRLPNRLTLVTASKTPST